METIMNAAIAIVRSRFVRSLLLAVALFGAAFTSSASVFVSVAFAPPPLPVYAQPICPGPEYIWVPGYWAYGPYGYYWVPGTWVLAPFVGALWTPGYWGWDNTVYVWHSGYWGRHVGFYGGINYGFGYFGVGYAGGYWDQGRFRYNSAVNNVSVTTVHNYVYNRPVGGNVNVTRMSYNGPGGTRAQPTPQDRIAQSESHRTATAVQVRHERLAATNRSQLASVNHGTPSFAATPRAAAFGQTRTAAGTAGGAGNAPRVESSHTGRAARAEANAPHMASPNASREHRAESNAPRTVTPYSGREHRAESNAPRTVTPYAGQEFRAERGNAHANAGPPHMQGAPRSEMHTQNMPRPQSAPAPQSHVQSAPRMQSMPPPERHAQNAPRPQGQPHEGRGGEKRQEEGRGARGG
jgi:hypothetical protein